MDFKEKNISSVKEINNEINNEAVNAQKEMAAPEMINEVKPEENKTVDKKKNAGKAAGSRRASIKDVKEKAKAIEVVVPKTAKEQALEKIKEMHQTLLDSETDAFDEAERDKIDRNTYRGLSKNDKKKRAEMAIKRRKLGQAVTDYEAAHPEKEKEPVIRDKETLKRKIAAFKKMRSKPYDMGSDEKFAANLEKNYKLCEDAETMRRYIETAVDDRFMIEKEDLHALLAKVEVFAEVKRYLDAQSALMKNPFYQYMAKDDISYTDAQIERLMKTSGNHNLLDYLANVKIIRSLHFIRHKGMDSMQKTAEDRGLDAAKNLLERDSKRKIVEQFTDIALRFKGNERFLDKDYDSRFTPEQFKLELDRFNAVKMSDLHFASIQDIVDHYEENQVLFDQTHDIEQLLMVAIQRGMAPDDSELIKLRARIETFTLAERMVSLAQETAIRYPDRLVKEWGKDEFIDSLFDEVRSYTYGNCRQDPPRIGSDLTAYMRELTRQYKQEHDDCEKTIRAVYGMTHGNDDMQPAAIPDDELARRKKDYQKNMFRAEYMRNTDAYIQNVYGDRVTAVAHAYANRTGIPVDAALNKYPRTLTPFLCGKSSQEIIRTLEIVDHGTEEQKDKLWTAVAKEAMSVNPAEYMTSDPEILFRNAAYKSRMAKIYGNLYSADADAVPANIKDKKLLKKVKAYYQAGCVFCANVLGVYTQAMRSPELCSLGIEDWVHSDFDKIYALSDSIQSGEMDMDRIKEVKICGNTYNWSVGRINRFDAGLKKIWSMNTIAKRHIGPDRFSGEVWDPVDLIMYDELKIEGLVKELTPDELGSITKTYGDLKAKYEAGEGAKLSAGLKLVRDDKSDKESKQKTADAIEGIFAKVMSFDVGRFDFDSYKDLYIAREKDPDPGRAFDCLSISRYADAAEKLIYKYREFRNDEEVRCRLNDIHVEEIAVRCDLIKKASVFYDDKFIGLMSSDQLAKTGLAFEDIIHMVPQEIDEKIEECRKSGDSKLQEFWTEAKAVRIRMTGFDIGQSLNGYESSVRADHELYKRSRADETANILNGIESALKNVNTGEIIFSCMSKEKLKAQFNTVSKEKSLTVSERDSKLDNVRSRLHVKYMNRNALIEAQKQFSGRTAAARNGITLENRVKIGDSLLNSLRAFMGDSAEENNALVTRYTGEAGDHNAVLDGITRELMAMNINIKAGSDAEFAAASPELEEISTKARAYEKLLNADPDYKRKLMTKDPVSMESDYDRVMGKLDQMLAISDYYRARRTLLTNPYYVLHYNDEMTADRRKALPGDQARCAGLIDLVAKCTERLNGFDRRTREAAGMERLLNEAESVSAQEALLRGRPDLTKADPSAVHKANKEIARYLEAANISEYDTGTMDDFLYGEHPNAEKYKTKAVKNYLDSVIYFNKMKGNAEKKETILPPERVALYRKLNEMLNDKEKYSSTETMKSSPKYKDPVTGEIFAFDTGMARLINSLCFAYAGNVSNEEITDMFEGFLLPHRKDVDLSKENVRLYVRERFLESMRKLFDLEFESLKRYQNTYGSLCFDLPPGVFMESLGESQKDFVLLNQSGQDMAELTDHTAERNCLVDGKAMTVAEVLIKYGKILKTKADNAELVGPDYYQEITGGLNTRFNSASEFIEDPEEEPKKYFEMKPIKASRYLKSNFRIGGPGVSHSEARRIWKKTLAYSDDRNLTGGDQFLKYNATRLGAFSSSQKKEMKKARRNDVELFKLYNTELDDREAELISQTKNAIGEALSDELLKKLIVFHPGLYRWGKKDEQQTADFNALIRQYAGIGVADEKKAEARKEASAKLYDLWSRAMTGVGFFKEIDIMMGDGDGLDEEMEARANPDEVMDGSRLYQGEVRHRMFESLRALANSAEYGFVFNNDEEVTSSKRTKLKNQLVQEIFRGIMKSDFYLDLKDVGSKERSYSERMYQKLNFYISKLQTDKYDPFVAFDDPEFKEAMDFVGVSLEGLKAFEIKAVQKEKKEDFFVPIEGVKEENEKKEEKKEEAKTKEEQKKPEAVKEEKKEEKSEAKAKEEEKKSEAAKDEKKAREDLVKAKEKEWGQGFNTIVDEDEDEEEEINTSSQKEKAAVKESVKEEKKTEQKAEPEAVAGYKPKIISNFIISNIEDGSVLAAAEDKTATGFAKYIADQTAQALSQHSVTWNDLKDELKYWMMGKEFNEMEVKTGADGREVLEAKTLKIDPANIDQLLEKIRTALIAEGKVIDEATISGDREALSQKYDAEPQYAKGSLKALLRAMIDVNGVQDLDQMKNLTVSDVPQTAEVMNNIKDEYPGYFNRTLARLKVGPDDDYIARTELKIPEKDRDVINWVFNEMPDGDLSDTQIAEFRNKWNKKLSLMLIEGNYPSKITLDKLRVMLDVWWGAANRRDDHMQKDRLLQNLAGVDLTKAVPDRRIENEDSAPNVHQWYGQSCWAASGSVVSGWYLRNVLKDDKTVIDQNSFLTPANLKLNPFAENLLEFEKKYPHGDEGIHGEVGTLEKCLKPYGETGSLIMTADTMLSKMKDTGVRHVRFAMTAHDPYMRNKLDHTGKLKLVKLLYEKIGDLIAETGGPISMLLPGHYRTVIGVEGNKIRFRDSVDSDGTKARTYTMEQFLETWEGTVLREGMYQVELVGLQHLTGADKDELKGKFGYNYNERGELQYSLKDDMKDSASTENIIHNLGCIYSNSSPKADNLLEKYLQDNLYVPRNLDNVKNVEETERRNAQLRQALGFEEKPNTDVFFTVDRTSETGEKQATGGITGREQTVQKEKKEEQQAQKEKKEEKQAQKEKKEEKQAEKKVETEKKTKPVKKEKKAPAVRAPKKKTTNILSLFPETQKNDLEMLKSNAQYPPQLKGAMDSLAKLAAMPKKTWKQLAAYSRQCDKYLQDRNKGMKAYIDSLPKDKFSSSQKKYLYLIADVSNRIDRDLSGLHELDGYEKICDLLGKIKKHSCFKDHDSIMPDFLKKGLSSANKGLLTDLIAEFESMKAPKSWEESGKLEGKKDRVLYISPQDLGTYVPEAVINTSSTTKSVPQGAEMNIAGDRFMEFMGMERNTRRYVHSYTTDKSGKRHWGFKYDENYSKQHKWMNKMEEFGVKDMNYSLMFSPDAIRQLSNLSILLPLMGRYDFDPADEITMMFSEYDISSSQSKTQYKMLNVSGVYLAGPGDCFSMTSAKDLKEGKGRLPSFDTMDIPFLDEEFVEKVLALKADDLYKITGGIVNMDQVKAYGERLALIQSLLKKRKAQDSKLPEKERTILKREDWEDPEVREKLENGLQAVNDQLCPELLEGGTLIEGAAHTGYYIEADPEAKARKENEREYYRLYEAVKEEYQEADGYEKKLDTVCNLAWRTHIQSHAKDKNLQLIQDVISRVLQEEADRETLVAYMERKYSLFRNIGELVQAKVNDTSFVVPAEAENTEKTKRNADKVRLQYAALTVRRENPDLFLEAGRLAPIAGFFQETSFVTMSLNEDMDNPTYLMMDLDKEMLSKNKQYEHLIKLGSNVIEYDHDLLDPELVRKEDEVFNRLDERQNEEFMKRFEGVV